MRRAASAFLISTGLTRVFPSLAENINTTSIVSSATLTQGASPSSSSSTSRPSQLASSSSSTAKLDQALAEMAEIGSRVSRQHREQQKQQSTPSPLAAAASQLHQQPQHLTLPSQPASSSSTSKPSSPEAALLRKTNRELRDELSGAQLAALAQGLYHGSFPGVPRDVIRASKFWVLAAGKGDLSSVLAVGLASVDGLGAIPQDWNRAYGLLNQLAGKAGHPWAHFALGNLLLRRRIAEANGSVIPASTIAGATGTASTSTRLTTTTAANQDNRAISSSTFADVAQIPLDSRKHPDCVRALASFRIAADAQVPPSYLNLANCLAHGIGISTSDDDAAGVEGLKWLEYAAQQNDPLAAATLAYAYQQASSTVSEDSSPVPSDSSFSSAIMRTFSLTEQVPSSRRLLLLQEAGKWWRVAALGGHPSAQHNLALAYMQGTAPGCESNQPDVPAALVWFQRAASSGVVKSALNAGQILSSGKARSSAEAATPEDKAAARDIYSTAISRLLLQNDGGVLRPNARKMVAVLQARLDSLDARAAKQMDSASLDGDGYDLEVVFDTPETRDAAFQSMKEKGGLTTGNLLEVLRSYSPVVTKVDLNNKKK